MADAGLEMVTLHVGLRPLHNSCVANVWPMPQISSRSPSTVKSAASDRARIDTPAAPMSGHFATLLRGTEQMLLADHDVYITDWHNARDVGLRKGRLQPGRRKPAPVRPCRNKPESSDRSLAVTDRLPGGPELAILA
jgi:hypothetical protein